MLGPEILHLFRSLSACIQITSWFLFAALTAWHKSEHMTCIFSLASTAVWESWGASDKKLIQ